MAFFPCNNNEPEDLYKKVYFDVTLSPYANPTGRTVVDIKPVCPKNYMDLEQKNFIVAPDYGAAGNYVAPGSDTWLFANISLGQYDNVTGYLPIIVTSSDHFNYYDFVTFHGYVYVVGGE